MSRGIILIILLFSATLMAADPPGKGPSRLEQLTQMRLKQEDEESVVRIITQPVQIQQANFCLPVEQARQRIRDLGKSERTFSGDVTVDAGHEEVSIDGNSGDIDNSVNVQIVNPGDDRQCF